MWATKQLVGTIVLVKIAYGKVRARAIKIKPIAVGGGIFDRFFELEKCQWEVADDIISDVAVD